MKQMIPKSRPQFTKAQVESYLGLYDLVKYPVKILGVRGYYKTTMGDPEKNDVGIYDDALFVVSKNFFGSYNANTDPSKIFKDVAVLKPGGPYLYKIGMHNMKAPYEALRQYGNVTVLRNGIPVTDSPSHRFYIDIHKGGNSTTSSLGCQTICPPQWAGFLKDVKQQLALNQQTLIPYILIEFK
jgi:lysozyme